MPETINTILSLDLTRVGVSASAKIDVLRSVSEMMAEQLAVASPQEILEGLLKREEMGSTGIGGGVAIPHCRLNGCTDIHGALIKLREPVEFDAIDGRPVDLVFALLGPEGDAERHLQVLAILAERLNRAEFVQVLREAVDEQGLYEAAVGFDPR